MQGTIATFDPRDHTGTLLLDDGTELTFGAEAFRASGLRLLRLGQRVAVTTSDDTTVTKVQLPGIS
ncbi:cold-shock protein [Symbioplanes lichenis]|uniref:cold-shock protein n=1 Tax=Symbioplanes lichenis TaxID=1629072 RepID=UPI0027397781|nr:cold-shock protein [Actinoplanes lichenis]